jgi:predicted transcriptional regulator
MPPGHDRRNLIDPGREILSMDTYLLELDSETKTRLEKLRSHPEEPYSRVINRLIDSYEDKASLTREEVEEIRQALRDLKEGRLVARGLVKEEPAPGQEEVPASIGDLQAVKDMEALFSGAARQVRDQELPPSDSLETDPGDIHEIEGFDTRGRSRTPRLDSL